MPTNGAPPKNSKIGVVERWFDTPEELQTWLFQRQQSAGYGIKIKQSTGRVNKPPGSPFLGKHARRYYACERGGKPTPNPHRKRADAVTKLCGCPWQASGNFYAQRARDNLAAWGLRTLNANHDCERFTEPKKSVNNQRLARLAYEAEKGVPIAEMVEREVRTGKSGPEISRDLTASEGIYISENYVKTVLKRIREREQHNGGEQGQGEMAKHGDEMKGQHQHQQNHHLDTFPLPPPPLLQQHPEHSNPQQQHQPPYQQHQRTQQPRHEQHQNQPSPQTIHDQEQEASLPMMVPAPAPMQVAQIQTSECCINKV